MRKFPAVDEPNTFTETAVREAAARRTRVDLVLAPVTPDTDSRLISRLLGINEHGDLVLDVPKTRKGKKVFIPAGWGLGMAFELANLWMQSRSTVVGHCQFAIRPGRRVDALMVERPEKIVSCNERKKSRHGADFLHPISATILAMRGQGDQGPPRPCRSARLRDWSEEGMGLEFIEPHDLEPNCQLVVQVRIPALERTSLFRGIVKHVTMVAPGLSLVGIGNIEEVTMPPTARQVDEAQLGTKSD